MLQFPMQQSGSERHAVKDAADDGVWHDCSGIVHHHQRNPDT